jgi:hemoglobin
MIKRWFYGWLKRWERPLYLRIGGEKTLNILVDDFYQIMQQDPAARHCLATHQGRDLVVAAEKLKFFLSGWLGGPQLYLEKYGHPRLRMRHFPFSIGSQEAEEWLYCMEGALKKSSIKPALQAQMLSAFREITKLTINRS